MNSRPKNSKFHRQTQRILDKRPCEVVPVGAWVELCPQNDNEAFAAVVSWRYDLASAAAPAAQSAMGPHRRRGVPW